VTASIEAARVYPLPVSWPLTAGKFQPPALRPGTIERRRVVARLLAEPHLPVVALIAPPGSGKTIVLAQWAAAETRPVAWLTLDALDNDPGLLVGSLVAALARIGPLGRSVASSQTLSPERIFGAAIPHLVSDVHRWSHPAVLIVDDVHRITNETALDALGALLDHLPPNLTVALAGRSEPGLPLGRLRARQDLLDLGPGALALDAEETAELIRVTGCRLDPVGVREVHRRSEGWAVGVYLAALACSRAETGAHGDPGAGIGVASGTAYIASYLSSELARTLTDDDLRLLTRSAILEIVTPGVADAVTGIPDTGPRLLALARRHLLIHQVGDRPIAFRYHNLLGDFLLEELDRREPGIGPTLHRRAASWYRRNGSLDLAIEHALAGGDLDAAADLVATAGPPLTDGGHLAVVERALGRPASIDLQAHPPVAVLAGWVHVLSGRPVDALGMAAIADAAATAPSGPPSGLDVEPQRAMLRAVLCPDGPRRMLADASLAVDQAQPDSRWRANAVWLLGAAHALLGDTEAAGVLLDEAIADATYGADLSVGAWTTRAALNIRNGDWDGAAALVGDARGRLVGSQYENLLPALPVHAVGARVAIRRGDLEFARELLVSAQLVRHLASHAAPWMSVDALLHLAQAYLAISDPAGAQIALREAEQIVRRRPALGILTDELIDIRKRLSRSTATLIGSSTLTTAELRILPLLPTYLSFQEIADRLGVSRNTVKTHAMSIYGKVWASSRGEAVERAVALGLLEPYPGLEPASSTTAIDDTPDGSAAIAS